MKGRGLSVPFTVGELRVPQNLNKLLQSGVHDNLVVITHEDVLENAVKEGESLRRLVTDHLRGAKVGQLSGEWLSMRDTRRVIQSENTKDITGFEGGTGLLDELDNTIFLRNQGHVHLHDLDFGEGLTSLDVLAVFDSELDKLSRRWRAELSRIILLLQQARLSVDTQTSCSRFLLPVDVVTATVQQNKQATVSQSTNTDRALGSVDEQVVAVQAGSGCGELVTLALVDEVHGENGLEDILGGHLTLFEALAILLDTGFAGQMSLGDRTAQNSYNGIWTLRGQLVRDELVQPSSGDGVLLESRRLQQLDQVLDRRAEVTTDAQLLQSNNHVFPRRRTVLTVGENVTELTVGEAVDTTGGTDGEVTPDVGRTAEIQFVHGTARGLETLAGIFGSDTAGGRVSLGLGAALGLEALFAGEVEVNLGRGVGVDTIEQTNVTDAVQGDTHGDLQLGGWQVDTGDHLSGGVLDLKTRVQFEEVELVIGVRVQVLNGTGGDVTDQLSKADSSTLHGLERGGLGDGDGGLLDNLLVPTLNGAVSAEQGDVVSVLISQQLDFQMPGIASQLHDEDRGTGDFVCGGIVKADEILLALDLTDTLTTTTFGGLDHHGETNLLGLLQTFFRGKGATPVVDLVGHGDNAILINGHIVNSSS